MSHVNVSARSGTPGPAAVHNPSRRYGTSYHRPALGLPYIGLVLGPTDRALLRMAQGYQLSQALYVAAKLGVADVVAVEALDVNAIAGVVGARSAELRRVLRALVAAGVFTELDDGRFALNDAAAGLQADAPARIRDVVINFGEEMYRAFGELLHTVRTGETAFEAVYGQPLFDYYASHPEAEASGSARMTARSLPVPADLVASGLVDGVATITDVGGGTGTVIAAILGAYPELRAVLYERPRCSGSPTTTSPPTGSSTGVRSSPGPSSSRCPKAPTSTC